MGGNCAGVWLSVSVTVPLASSEPPSVNDSPETLPAPLIAPLASIWSVSVSVFGAPLAYDVHEPVRSYGGAASAPAAVASEIASAAVSAMSTRRPVRARARRLLRLLPTSFSSPSTGGTLGTRGTVSDGSPETAGCGGSWGRPVHRGLVVVRAAARWTCVSRAALVEFSTRTSYRLARPIDSHAPSAGSRGCDTAPAACARPARRRCPRAPAGARSAPGRPPRPAPRRAAPGRCAARPA